jgi:hypothetical protein
MKIIALGLTTAFCAGLALPAAASPVFDAFAKACGDTHMDYPAIVKALDYKDWKPVAVKSATMEGVAVSESVSRGAKIGDTALTLFAWHGLKGAIQITACSVRVTGGKFDDLKADTQAWAGFAPQSEDPKKASFHFTQDGGVHKPLEKSDYEAAAGAAGLEFLTVSQDGPETILDLLKIKK